MRQYKVQPGDSPTIIARAYRVPFEALISANAHKPTVIVNGRRTWDRMHHGEVVNIPSVGIGALGAVAPADPMAPHALIQLNSSGPDVALWQTILGVTPDGSFGPHTDAATRAWQSAHGLSADGVVGSQTWAAAIGGMGATPAPSTSTPTPAAASGVATAAAAALLALRGDSNYCTSVSRVGSAVNAAVHNFKAAWNAANPGRAVPIGTGNYEPSVASALSSALGGAVVPSGCGAGAQPAPQPAPAPAPSVSPPMPAPPPPAVTPAPAPAPAPTAGGYSSGQIAAATAMNSALAAHGYKQSDQPLYMAFQRVMGLTADGYPGQGTMGMLRTVLGAAGIPMASVPVYPWHSTGAYDGVNAPTAAQWAGTAPAAPAPPMPVPPEPPQPAPAPAPTPAPVGPGGTPPAPVPAPAPTPIVVAPEAKPGISTGAIVAGAAGILALGGLVALVATSGKKKSGHAGRRHSGGSKRKKSSKKRK